MKPLTYVLFLCWLCACNTLHVSQTKNNANTPAVGVEWSFSDFANDDLRLKVDSVILNELSRFNTEGHVFTVHQRKRGDKGKDYITIDFKKGKVVSTGGKIAGYTVTAIGLIATPAILIAAKSPVIVAFYYWPTHQINSKITLSPNLSDDRKNDKNLITETGALFAATGKQVDKLLRKYADGIHNTLLDMETQLGQHK